MLRTLVGYAILALIGFFALKLVLTLLGFAFTLLMNLLWLAALGFLVYLVLKLISPDLARRVHDKIAGVRRAA
jgi:zinc transporter ZupT